MNIYEWICCCSCAVARSAHAQTPNPLKRIQWTSWHELSSVTYTYGQRQRSRLASRRELCIFECARMNTKSCLDRCASLCRGHDVPSMHSNHSRFLTRQMVHVWLDGARIDVTPSPEQTNKICSLQAKKKKWEQEMQTLGKNATKTMKDFSCLFNANINCNRDSFHIPVGLYCSRSESRT